MYFTLSEVATIAQIPVATLRDWFGTRTGAFYIGHEDHDAPAGGTRLVTPATALAVAIAAQLVRLGVARRRAAEAGLLFAHTANGHPKRRVGDLYEGSDRTLIAVPDDGPARIFAFGPKSDPALVLTKIGAGGAAVLPINAIVERVRSAIGGEI
jgi:hypothetical protein